MESEFAGGFDVQSCEAPSAESRVKIWPVNIIMAEISHVPTAARKYLPLWWRPAEAYVSPYFIPA